MAKAATATSVEIYRNISRPELIEVIAALGQTGMTVVARGHAGSGKSDLRHDLALKFPKHKVIMVDMSPMAAGDLLMPKFAVVNSLDVVRGVPHEDLGFHVDGDVIIILDEIYKTPKALQYSLARLVYEKTLGQLKLSKDSFIVGLSNLEEEGFSDSSVAFIYDRIQEVEMRKPDADEWLTGFALNPKNNVHPSICAAAKEFPTMFADYRDYSNPDDNPYIFDPRRATSGGFTTGRSLAMASMVLHSCGHMSNTVLTHLLAKKVGARAAMDIMAVHILQDQLPSWKDIIENPLKTAIPKSAGAQCLLIYTAIQKVEKDTILKWMTYLKRMEKEIQALFATTILRVNAKSSTISAHKEFVEWAKQNDWLF